MAQNNGIESVTSGPTVFPAPVSKTGTITSDGTVVTGTTTNFSADVEAGDWIWNPTASEVRQVRSVSESGEWLYLEKAFSANITTGIALQVVPSPINRVVSIANIGSANGTVDGETFIPTQSATDDRTSMAGRLQEYVDPIVLNGSGTELQVKWSK